MARVGGFGASGAFVAGAGTSGRVLYVLLGGLFLYNILERGGAVAAVSGYLGKLEPEREGLALVVVIGAAPFFESVTGFGVAVVISAPILLAAGFSPLKAAVLSSWGQCAVPWGALGIGTVIGADLSGTTFGELSDGSALLSLPLFPVYAVAAVALAGGWAGVRKRGGEAVLLGLVAGTATLLTSLFVVPELAGAVGGLAATGAFLILRRGRLRGSGPPIRAALPYAFLLLLLVLANGPGPIAGWLGSLGPAFSGPGPALFLAAGFGAALFGLGGGALRSAASGTLWQWLPTAGAVVTFVLAGGVVAASGAAAMLAAAATVFGPFYGVAAPVVGALGGALTGSNAASNALFMPLQVEAARGLGVSEGLVAAVQNVSGSHASMLAPQRVVLAATAVGLLGREGEIVRAALLPVAASVAVLAVAGAVL
ncbi:L-lactate permease [Rubrobacter marinus]|uniref:L-lactate permease n=1 Tax=Rubrobacter marinus TaxID=2653852 RepID=UPI00140BC0AB|nr:L-lactate permease [Rubrobacter marinus]